MECPASLGPHKRAWVAAGYAYFFDDGLMAPRVMLTDDQPPVAAIPAWAGGTPCEDVFFAFCSAELVQQRVGVLKQAERLLQVCAPVVSALMLATLALGLNPWDGLNAIERIIYQAVRLVG